jgi:hypothetical protein
MTTDTRTKLQKLYDTWQNAQQEADFRDFDYHEKPSEQRSRNLAHALTLRDTAYWTYIRERDNV